MSEAGKTGNPENHSDKFTISCGTAVTTSPLFFPSLSLLDMGPRITAITLALALCCDASSIAPRGDGDAAASRYVKFSVIHSTNTDVFAEVWAKRGVETLPLANRSDVAYYAKRTPLTPKELWISTFGRLTA
jgi:hypothetical protein